MIGKIIANRYEVISKLGSGGMAVVYRAKDRNLGRDVALKVLKESVAEDPEFRERFRREARASAILTHRNIVQVYDYFEDNDGIFIVMELVDGHDLSSLLRHVGSLNEDEAVDIISQVLNALEFSHSRGIVHRDISARNVLIAQDGTVKVTDFGIARVVGERSLTKSGELIGSVQYISPEQASGGEVTSKSDLYSVGVLLYEILTGRLPFNSDHAVKLALMHVQAPVPKPSQVNSKISAKMDRVVLKAMSKRPEDRYYNAQEMRSDLLGQTQTQFSPPISMPIPTSEVSAGKFEQIERTVRRMEALQMPTDDLPADDVDSVDTIDFSQANYEQEEMEDYDPYEPEEIEMIEEEADDYSVLNKGLSIAISVVLVVLLAFVGGVAYLKYKDSENIVVPNIIGQKLAVAREVLESRHLSLEIRSRKYSATDTPGMIVSQDPIEGSQVVSGDKVFVVVSVGRNKVMVPNLLNMDESVAREQLRSMELECVIAYLSDPDAKFGVVLKQEPDPNSEINSGGEVKIYINDNLGEVVVPNILDLNLDKATQILKDLGLDLQIREKRPDAEAKEGTIIAQEPARGDKIKKNGIVYVTVAEAMAKKTAPSLVGLSIEEAQKKANSLGLKLSVSGDLSKESKVKEQSVAPGEIISDEKLAVVCERPEIHEPESSESELPQPSVETKNVPNICGLKYDVAVEELHARGLKVGKIETVPGNEGSTVVEQTPVAGEVVEAGTRVNLVITQTVSTPSPAPVPSSTPTTEKKEDGATPEPTEIEIPGDILP
ncbi:Stk1 family PASTA domain-containing Ser/Thr kinase [bacterium]|nr:Stk1 family PASTA domain-containing Ser/Thr kinase [bacterium]